MIIWLVSDNKQTFSLDFDTDDVLESKPCSSDWNKLGAEFDDSRIIPFIK